MNAFDAAFDHIIIVEGGSTYTDIPGDSGGPTRYGITQRTLSVYLGRPVSVFEVKNLDISTAKSIYKKFYWDAIRLDLLPTALALAVFDQAVNRGPYQAVVTLQRCLNVLADGQIGPITLQAISVQPIKYLIFEFCMQSHKAYIDIVKANPSQLIFLYGWSNRVHNLIEKLCLG